MQPFLFTFDTMQQSISAKGFELNDPITECEATWGPVACPNKPEFVLVTKRAVGFCPVCGPHAEAYELKDKVNIIPLVEFEKDREKYLYPRLELPTNANS